MARHPLRDHLVVLDDQNLRHACLIIGRAAPGWRRVDDGEGVVNEGERVRAVVARAPEPVVVLDSERRVVAASRSGDGARRARRPAAGSARSGRRAARPLVLYLGSPPELSAYQELAQGFTAAVSHELRTPLARLLVAARERDASGRRRRRADGAGAAGGRAGARADRRRALPRRARDRPRGRLARSHTGEAGRRGGRRLVQRACQSRRGGLGSGRTSRVEVPLRPRMLRVVVENLLANAIRYAGPGTHAARSS